MLAWLIQRTRSTRLDDMVTMLARFIGRIEAKARADTERSAATRRTRLCPDRPRITFDRFEERLAEILHKPSGAQD